MATLARRRRLRLLSIRVPTAFVFFFGLKGSPILTGNVRSPAAHETFPVLLLVAGVHTHVTPRHRLPTRWIVRMRTMTLTVARIRMVSRQVRRRFARGAPRNSTFARVFALYRRHPRTMT